MSDPTLPADTILSGPYCYIGCVWRSFCSYSWAIIISFSSTACYDATQPNFSRD